MAKKQKLELTWIGKDDEVHLEPRVLIENTELSYGDKDTGNMIIHGDNLLALKALEQDYAGKVKCIYIDPPYNTGNAFEHYDDGLEHSIWLSLMKKRLEYLKNLLKQDGSIYVQIDDVEMAYLKVIMDEVFGRNNFVTSICIQMSHLSGVKMSHVEKKPPKIKEFILIYSKNKVAFSVKPVFTAATWKESLDRYTQIVVNFDDPINEWKSLSMGKYIQEIVKKDFTEVDKEKFLIKNSYRIFRTARNRSLEATGIKNIFSEILTKRGLSKIILNDEEVLFAGEKIKEIDGVVTPFKILGDIWTDIGINNLHKEGQIDFRNGKKPEKLISRIIEMSSNVGDLILDSFLGSGTTAAVAHKMNRKYIGIELGDHATTHSVPRLQSVIDGLDTSGISKILNWQGGGGFNFYTLAPSLLKKDKFDNWIIEPSYDANLLASALAKQEAFTYHPDSEVFWKQGHSTENDFIFTTTQFITVELIDRIHEEMGEDESLLVCAKTFQDACVSRYDNITIKKIPKALLGKCEFGKDDYSLNIIETEGVEANDE